jgi:hypothetical protein
MRTNKHRLITRADFDGVVCGALLHERALIGDVVFAEPREMQTGTFDVRSSDITANLPYVPRVHHCFDHHSSEVQRVGSRKNLTLDPAAPSAARVIYEHFGGPKGFPDISTELIEAVDKADSAQFDVAEILSPTGWVLVNFILDPRTGLSDAAPFDTSNGRFLADMMVYCRHHPVDEILKIPDVAERVRVFWTNEEGFELQLRRQSKLSNKIVFVDFREEKRIFAGNRFTVYALYPECNVSIMLLPSKVRSAVTIAVGKSILNRTSSADLGAILLEFGGGGHAAAGTCDAPRQQADEIVAALAARIEAAN